MQKKRSNKISTLGSRMTSVFSVSLVLLLVGLITVLGIAAGRVTSGVLGNVSIIVRLDYDADLGAVTSVGSLLSSQPYAASLSYTSADDVLKAEMEYNSEILDLLDENPYSAEYEVKLVPTYVHADSIRSIAAALSQQPHIDEVITQTDVVDAVDSAISNVSIVLGIVALALLVISIVLIYNTVSIGVYSRRFVIHTMQLVGATGAFITRPFIVAGVTMGVIAAVIASALLVLCQWYASTISVDLALTLHWGEVALVCLGLLVLGIAICATASLCATRKYLRKDLDSLYK